MTTKFWYGGSGNWSDATNHWSLNSGNVPASPTTVPTSADNVIFDSLSNATAYTVTVDATANCLDMTWSLPLTSGVPRLTLGGNSVLIYGSSSFVAGMTIGASGNIQYLATSTGKTITSNGVALSCSVIFGGVGGGWTLQDALSLDASSTIIDSTGTLNTNAKTVTCGFFVSTSGTRTLTLTGSTINITGTSGTPISLSTTGALTLNSTGAIWNVIGGAVGVVLNIQGASLNLGSVNIAAPGIWVFNGNPTLAGFSYTSTTNKTDRLAMNTTTLTISAGGSLTFAGNSTVNRALVNANSLGSQVTFSVPSGATVTITNTDFQDIKSAGTFGTWTGTSLGDCLGNSGITFDASVQQTLIGTGTINWSTAANWTSRVPLPQDDVVLPNMGVTTNLTADMPRLGRNMTATNYDRAFFFNSIATTIFGNLAYGVANSFNGTPQTLTLMGRGAQTITDLSASSGSKPATQISSFGGSYTLLSDLNLVQGFVITNGTWNGNGFNLFASTFTSTGASATVLNLGSGTYNIAGTTGTRWAISASNHTVNAGTSTIKFTATSTGDINFSGAGYTYNNIYWSSTAAQAGKLNILGANTFNDFKVDGTTARTVQFPASTTQTVTTFTVSGADASHKISLTSSAPGTPATLSKASGIVSSNYLSLTDSRAIGGAAWFAGAGSSNGGGDSGWIFAPPPALQRSGAHWR